MRLKRYHNKIAFDFTETVSDEEKTRLFGSITNYLDCYADFTKKGVPPKICDYCSNITRGGWSSCKPCGIKRIKPVTKELTPICGLFISGSACDYQRYDYEYHKRTGKHIGVTRVLIIGASDVKGVEIPGAEKYMRVVVNDDPTDAELLFAQMKEMFEFIAGGVTLVHCKAGASRSATVVIAYLMFIIGSSVNNGVCDMYCYLYNKRPILNINAGFLDLLLDYSKDITDGTGRFKDVYAATPLIQTNKSLIDLFDEHKEMERVINEITAEMRVYDAKLASELNNGSGRNIMETC
jgi:hypothetical protein